MNITTVLENETRYRYNVSIDLEEHTACEYACKISEEQCNKDTQIFDQDECACLCNNIDDFYDCKDKVSSIDNEIDRI